MICSSSLLSLLESLLELVTVDVVFRLAMAWVNLVGDIGLRLGLKDGLELELELELELVSD